MVAGDVEFGAVVEKKMRGGFLVLPRSCAEPRYECKLPICGRKYRSQCATMSIVHELSDRRRPPSVTRVRRTRPRKRTQAASAALAFSAIAWNAAGSLMARSDSTLRSTMMPDLERPSINRL